MKIRHSLAQLLVSSLLEDVMGPEEIADQYIAWTLQRGGSGYDQSTFNAWLGYMYPKDVKQSDEIYAIVKKQIAA